MRKQKGYKINFEKNVLILNYRYNRLAALPGSDEYKNVRAILGDNPGMRVVVESGHRAKTPHHSRRLTYLNMEHYIRAQDNAEELMAAFAIAKEESKKEKSPYAFVRSWFLKQFPNSHEVRLFIAQSDEAVKARKNIEELPKAS